MNKRGPKVNPNSSYQKAKQLILSLDKRQLNRKFVLTILMNELQLKQSVASVYYYKIIRQI